MIYRSHISIPIARYTELVCLPAQVLSEANVTKGV